MIFMSRQLFVFASVLSALFFMNTASASNACATSEDVSRSEQAMWLDGTVNGQKDLVLCIEEAWQNFDRNQKIQSAEFVLGVSRNLIAALKFNASSFVKVMDSHPWLLDRWMRNIEFDAFTWHDDPPCAYLPQIEDIRVSLRGVTRSGKLTNSYKKIASRFARISCSQVD